MSHMAIEQPEPESPIESEEPELLMQRGGSYVDGVYTVFVQIPNPNAPEGEPENLGIVSMSFNEDIAGLSVISLIQTFMLTFDDSLEEIDRRKAEELAQEAQRG